jgi:ABC-type uncharacterized transport system involved in gliding motility auxiliary subunit
MGHERRLGSESGRNLAAIALALVIFVSLNVWAGSQLGALRLDLTEERTYTLSDGTRQVLAEIDEPITLRLYQSRKLAELGPFLAAHVRRVGELLETYQRLSGGKIRIERYDPEPFSPEEDLAVADEIQGIPVGDGTQIYFGLAGVNSTDDHVAIGYLAPERASFLEYDLTRTVHDLANPDKPVLGILGDLPLRGTQFNDFRGWAVTDALAAVAEIRSLGPDVARIPEDIDVLLLAEPASIIEAGLYAIDQFVLGGGRVIAFLDPFSEVALQQRQPGAPAASVSSLEPLAPLLEAWGVTVDPNLLATDREAAVRVQTRFQNRDVVTDYLAWMGLPKDRLAADDVITGQLQQINLRSAGIIRAREEATTTLTPLISTGTQSMEIETASQKSQPDPVGLLQSFEPSGERLIIAARVTGPVVSAFPEGPPESASEETTDAGHLTESTGPANLILVADSDILANSTWVQRRSLLGQTFDSAIANNGDFVVNAVDNLAGAAALLGLRGKGLSLRRFEVLDAMTRKAEDAYRAKEEELLVRITEVQAQIEALREEEATEGRLLTAAQQRAIDDFRGDLLELRAELREVQFALGQDVERLEFRIKAVNIWAVPALVALVAIVLALTRRLRAVSYRGDREAVS